MKRKELNYTYFEELRKSLNELYLRSRDGLTFKNLKKLITRKDNFLVALRELSYTTSSETPGLDGLKFSDIKYKHTYEETLSRFHNFSCHSTKLVTVSDNTSSRRLVGINNISDRIVQQMIYNVLEPICEGKFKDVSFGSRREVSTKDALHKLVRHSMTNPYAVSIDIKNFYGEIPHWKVIQSCYDIGIRDKWVLKAIKTILKSPIHHEDGTVGVSKKGILQAGILASLLANIVLHEFDDWFLSQWVEFTPRTVSAKHNFHSKVNSFHLKVPTDKSYKITYTSIWRGKKVNKSMIKYHQRKIKLKQGYLIRYADDIVIVCKNNKTAIRWKFAAEEKLSRMGLTVNEEKTKLTDSRLRKLNFLGYELKLQDGTQRWKNRKIYHPIILMSKENYERNKKRCRELLRELYYNRTTSFSYNSFITGVCNYFDYITFYWDTTNNLQNDVEKLYRKLHGRNGWRYSYIPKQYLGMKVHGISLARYKKRKVVWRVKDENIEVLHIWEYKSRERYMYDRPSFPHDRIMWDKASDHLMESIFKTDWYKREKYMIRKNLACQMYFPSLFSSQRGKCKRCKEDLYGLNTEVNHIVREDQGGSNEYSNLELLCASCHLEVTKEQLLRI